MFGFKVPLRLPDSPYPIYISDDAEDFLNTEVVRSFLGDVFFLLQAQDFSDGESAYFYRNGIRCELKIERDVKSILDGLIEIIDKHYDVFKSKSKTSISKRNLPDNLKILFPFLISQNLPLCQKYRST